MAIKINAVEAQRQFFATKPNIQVDITLEDGEHQWTLHGGGVLLRSELSRYALQLRDLGNMAKNFDNDDEAGNQVSQDIEAAWERFRSCFLANMTSEDGSAERWINDSKYDYVTMPAILSQILEQAGASNA